MDWENWAEEVDEESLVEDGECEIRSGIIGDSPFSRDSDSTAMMQ